MQKIIMDKARELSLKILYKIDKEKAYSNIILDKEIQLKRKNLTSKDIGLISEIVYGVTTWKLTLDEIIKRHSKIKMKKISIWILNILRMSIYQIIFLDKIPKSAAVNEGVNLAKRYGNKGSAGFVNALLRNIDKNDYTELFEEKDIIKRISITNSMPKWIIEELKNEGVSIEKIEEICKNSNLKPEISIRSNKLKTTKEDLKKSLQGKGYKVKDGILNDFLILEKAQNINNSSEFKNGYFTFQDEAAGLTALILNPKEGENVLDACSSPGGKTTYLAELMNNIGNILALDVYEHRLKLVEENAKRLGINIIHTNLQDGTIYNKDYREKFDKVLLDVPCLGIGVLKRKPDIKWQRKKEDIEKITNLQYSILENCSKYLKNDGELVYSTCSIFKTENYNIIEKFLKENSNFIIEKIKIDNFFEKYVEKTGVIQVYQNEKTDGFFICKLCKKSAHL